MSISGTCLLTFWSRFCFADPQIDQNLGSIKSETAQKSARIFELTASQNGSGFIEDPEELKANGFFEALAFLDDFKNEDATQESPNISNSAVTDHTYTKQIENESVNDSNITKRSSEIPNNQFITNPYENGKISNGSIKNRRSLKISEYSRHVIENNSSSPRKTSSSKQPKYTLLFKKKVVAEKTKDITLKMLQEKYGVTTKTISRWIKSLSLETV